ncbi:unnamed protein product [Callosobruchus maculatus]|uniref:Uncharacterized protein n=1 Tax=Callosobruchus maculatus TaxID=64391 RepID=A0A653D5P2_CALMS|nr:unnamed protein product [Callosobruchus maculatus]
MTSSCGKSVRVVTNNFRYSTDMTRRHRVGFVSFLFW